jgi:glycosyltransferase involved in cell wall biosynthesis
MKISVIIPVYNAKKQIERAVNSALIQTEVAEIVLIDDGSKDDSLNICNGLCLKDQRIKVYHHQDHGNLGPSSSRNLGVLKARHDWISFLDADDFFLPDRFKVACELLNEDTSLDGVYESVELEPDQNYTRKKIEVYKNNIEPEMLFLNLSPLGNSGLFHGNGFLVRKSLLLDAGLFNVTMDFGEDVLLWLKCAFFGRLGQGRINRSVAIMTRDGNNLTHNVVLKHHLIAVYENLLEDLKNKLSNEQRAQIIGSLMFSYLSINLEHKSQIVAFMFYFCQIIGLICKYPGFLFSRQFVLALKSSKKIVFRTNDVIP